MLSLTDMWRAAKSDPARQPSNWLGSADAKRFIETLYILEPGNSGVQTKRGGRGIGGSTFAHWQIALAHAKYLSPEFHMWCNTVVRERMEARAGIAALDGDQAKMGRALDSVGIAAQRSVQRKMSDGPFTPIAEETKAARLRRKAAFQKAGEGRRAKMMAKYLAGDFTPLIDTGQLRSAITYVIRNRKGGRA